MSRAPAALKRVLVGRPMSSGELEHTLLPKTIALPVFSSDPLSSNAYATQEILLVLGTAGVLSLSLVFPIAIAVALLLATVVTSYRQTVQAYPMGGGAYRVARENIGTWAGLLAASALLVDYVLTVAVSVVAGVDAIISAAPGFAAFDIELAILFAVLVALLNLRGVRESGALFAIPTYGFVLSIYVLLIAGFTKCLGGCPPAETAGLALEPHTVLGPLLLLKAFAAGTTALTGVEAIADGAAAFRYPQSRNAATTLTLMGAMTITMFLGISWLADHTNAAFTHDMERTVVAQLATAVFGGGPMFYVVQIMTAGILILAANTAFQDFPRLSSILATDGFLPRQFRNRGDRLVFSNGVLILTVLAALLIWAFNANLNSLIQLYLVGVFISFTLSQTGMVMRWKNLKTAGWRRRAAINGFGAAVTGIVFFVIAQSKFLGGAWIVLVAIPLVMVFMRSIHKHYEDVAGELSRPDRVPEDRRPGNQHMLILVERVNEATMRAVAYVRAAGPAEASAVTLDPSNAVDWEALAIDVPLTTLDRSGSEVVILRRYVRSLRSQLSRRDFLTLVVPEELQDTGMREIVRHPARQRLKAAFLSEPGVQVLDIPLPRRPSPPARDDLARLLQPPARHTVCILVSNVHNATLQAIEYAETLGASDIRAVSFVLDPEQSERLTTAWLGSGIPHPLEIEDSPFRDIGRSLSGYLLQFQPDGIHRVVTVVIPEFVVDRRRHQFLHGQTALIIKRHLLFEPGIVTVSVPYHLKTPSSSKKAASNRTTITSLENE
jgi:amino acid transporter